MVLVAGFPGEQVTVRGVAEPLTLFTGIGVGHFVEELASGIDDSLHPRGGFSIEWKVFSFRRIDRETEPRGEVNDSIGRAEVAAHAIALVRDGAFGRRVRSRSGADLEGQVGTQDGRGDR